RRAEAASRALASPGEAAFLPLRRGRCPSCRAPRHRVAPCLVIEVPAHGLANAGGEGLPRRPAELALDLGGIDRIAPVVAEPVLHEGDEVGVFALLAGQRFLKKIADGLDDLVVELLAIPAGVV